MHQPLQCRLSTMDVHADMRGESACIIFSCSIHSTKECHVAWLNERYNGVGKLIAIWKMVFVKSCHWWTLVWHELSERSILWAVSRKKLKLLSSQEEEKFTPWPHWHEHQNGTHHHAPFSSWSSLQTYSSNASKILPQYLLSTSHRP